MSLEQELRAAGFADLGELEGRLRGWLQDEADSLAICTCGSEDIEGACVSCGDLKCGACAVLAGDGIQCEDCRWGRD